MEGLQVLLCATLAEIAGPMAPESCNRLQLLLRIPQGANYVRSPERRQAAQQGFAAPLLDVWKNLLLELQGGQGGLGSRSHYCILCLKLSRTFVDLIKFPLLVEETDIELGALLRSL